MDEKGEFEEAEDILAKKRALTQDIKFKGIRKAISQINYGRAYTQFSPKGFAEKTIIYLQDNNSNIISVVINPLTAETDIQEGIIKING